MHIFLHPAFFLSVATTNLAEAGKAAPNNTAMVDLLDGFTFGMVCLFFRL